MTRLRRVTRPGDPDNVLELQEIAEAYRSIRPIVAHAGEDCINCTGGPCSWNTSCKFPEAEALRTFSVHERRRALIEAVKRPVLGKDTVESILFQSSARLLGDALPRLHDLGNSP